MASNYRAEMSTPSIFHGYLDQGKPSIFAAAIKQSGAYVRPSGNATFHWRKTGEPGGGQELTLPVTTSEGIPPWSVVTVPADTFPAVEEIEYSIRYSGWGGLCSVPLNDQGGLELRCFHSLSPPYIELFTPGDGGFVDDRSANSFCWQINYSKNYTLPESQQIKQQAAVFEWRIGEGGAINRRAVAGAAQELLVPANIFPVSGGFQWRVTVTMTDGAGSIPVGVPSAPWGWVNIETTDSPPTTRIIAPKAEILTGNEPRLFQWEHITATATAQNGAQLRYSADKGMLWQALASVIGTVQSKEIPAGMLPGGSLLWQVRTGNSDGLWGEWSEAASIVVYAAPATPVLLPVMGIPRPLIRWQSSEQQAFEVRVDERSDGARFGTKKEYQIPEWLSDGSHCLAVRVQSSLGLWSEWASITVAVKNVPPKMPTLTARGIENGVRLLWTGTFSRCLLYRDEEEIGEVVGNEWIDWLAVGRHRYRVRGIVGENYAMSNEAAEYSRCKSGVISAVGSIDWIPLRVRRGSPPSHTAEGSREVRLRYFAGREKPVAEVSGFLNRTHTLSYSLRPGEQVLLEQLHRLVGETVIYKNTQGARVIGVLSAVSDLRDWAADLTLTILETDWKEAKGNGAF